MNYQKEEALKCLNDCRSILLSYKLPLWDELPKFDLYMDQVIELANDCLGVFNLFLSENSEITKSMINNYVKLKMMPAPENKKYSRLHIAYILIICTLKQTLNIATIQKILPTDISEDEVKYIYDSFVKNQETAFGYVYNQVELVANPILKAKESNPHRIDDLIMQVASSANVLKCLTERVVGLSSQLSEQT